MNLKKNLKINHATKTVEQIRLLAPPTINARFRDQVREEYPEYQHKFK